LRQGRPDVDVPVGVALPVCRAAAPAFAFLFHVILANAVNLIKHCALSFYFGLFVPFDYFGGRFDCKKKAVTIRNKVNSALKLPLAFFVIGNPFAYVFWLVTDFAKKRLGDDVPVAADRQDLYLPENAPLHALLLAKIVSYFSRFLEGIGIQKSPNFTPVLLSVKYPPRKRHVRLECLLVSFYYYLKKSILQAVYALINGTIFALFKKARFNFDIFQIRRIYA
jgi:hypothetical protein